LSCVSDDRRSPTVFFEFSLTYSSVPVYGICGAIPLQMCGNIVQNRDKVRGKAFVRGRPAGEGLQ